MNLLALVDAKYRFVWASLGSPGNTHDSTYFQITSLWDEIIAGKVLSDINCVVDGFETPPDFLSNGAFSLRSWITKPHGKAILTPEKVKFNYHLSRARLITEGGFGKWKRRFRVLFRKCESNKEIVKIMDLACVLLHNLCTDKEDIIIPRKFDLSYDHVTIKRRDRTELRDMPNLNNGRLKNYDKGRGEGVKVREALIKAFLDEIKTEFVIILVSESISKRALLGNFFTISNVP